MARVHELRLMARVARLYYEQRLSQSSIANQLHVSQSTVSRLLKRAEREEIVRIRVSVPRGVYPELEEELVATYGLQDAVVADCIRDDEEIIQRNVGEAAAHYLETTLGQKECIGISSWSGTLLAMVRAMHQIPRPNGTRVVQILGGASQSQARVHAAYLATRLAELVRGQAVFLPAPVVVGSEEAREILLSDPSIHQVTEHFRNVTLALVGIGTVQPSPLLASSGNIFSVHELDILRANGAVGDILMHFFDSVGNPVQTPLDKRVIGMELNQLCQVRRAIGVAGGQRKTAAIRGAIRGGLINVLITDRFVAERLVSYPTASDGRDRPMYA